MNNQTFTGQLYDNLYTLIQEPAFPVESVEKKIPQKITEWFFICLKTGYHYSLLNKPSSWQQTFTFLCSSWPLVFFPFSADSIIS